MKPYDSVCFVANKIDVLNDLATHIDDRLFLFAFYEPKAWPEKESSYTRFYTAIVNLYGLFWDCGPFVRTRLMVDNVDHPCNSILPQGAEQQELRRAMSERFNDLVEAVIAFRSIFCHNNSSAFYFNSRMQDAATNWCKKSCGIYKPLEDLNSVDWKKMLGVLAAQACQVVEDIEFCLNELIRLIADPYIQIRNIINQWLIFSIGGWYRNNPELLLNAMAEFYMLYIGTEEKGASNGVYDYKLNLRQNVKSWLVVEFGADSRKWHSKWLESSAMNTVFLRHCPRPALPDEFFKVLADDVYNFSLRNALG